MAACTFIIEKLEEKVTSEVIFKTFEGFPYTIIMDSSLKDDNYGQYSIVAINPFMIFKSKGTNLQIFKDGKIENHNGNPLDYLKALLNSFSFKNHDAPVPFLCGCAGFFSYDLCNLIETLPLLKDDDNLIPDICLGFYNTVITINHKDGSTFISAASIGLSASNDIESILTARISEIKRLLKSHESTLTKNAKNYTKQESSLPCSNFSKEAYCKMVKRAKEYIHNGDIYQVNLSQRFKIPLKTDSFSIFNGLRNICPAPFSAYLNFEDIQVISSSPERFIKIVDGFIESRPIKGTRPRGKTKLEDISLKSELINSEKDRAELTMIVDLVRNDLGRVCDIGSVQVEKLFEIEEYSNVFHLVSTIKGKLKDGIDIIDCLKAAFPGGSITGAPKISAMEIIETLEPHKRGVYTGSIGYINFNGSSDLNIAIRTIIIKDNTAFYDVGGGIVWDSNPEMEYQETLDKGKAMMEVLSSINY